MSESSQSPRPAATVIVATCDRPDFLPDCVRSIASCLTDADELVVAEAGDSGAGAAVAAVAQQARHIHLTQPGKSRQLNEAVKESNNEILVFTDDDCRVEAGWLDAMVAPLRDDPQVAIAFGPVRGLTHVPGGDPLVGPPPGDAPFATWSYAHGASFAVRRRALVEIGGFDERLGPGSPAHGEEHDVLLRLREAGWRAVIAAAPAVTHLDWRDEREGLANALVYERGSGAFIGAALRRARGPSVQLLKHRLGYQLQLLRNRDRQGWTYGLRALVTFAGGLLYGLRLRRWTPPRG